MWGEVDGVGSDVVAVGGGLVCGGGLRGSDLEAHDLGKFAVRGDGFDAELDRGSADAADDVVQSSGSGAAFDEVNVVAVLNTASGVLRVKVPGVGLSDPVG